MFIANLPEYFNILVIGKKEKWEEKLSLARQIKNTCFFFSDNIQSLKDFLHSQKNHIVLIDHADSPIDSSKLSEMLILDYPESLNIVLLPSEEYLFDILNSLEEGMIYSYLYAKSLPIEFKLLIKNAIKKFCDLVITQELVYKVKVSHQNTQDELKKQHKNFDLILNEKNRYFHFIVHEIKGRLTSILGFIEMLQKQDLEESERKDFMELAFFNSNEILRMIYSILELARSNELRVEIKKRPFSIRKLFYKMEKTFSILARQKNISLHFLSPETDDMTGDPEKIEMAFSNIISNAVKYTEKGEVTVGLEKDEDGILFFVKDTGRGISNEEIHAIFNPYIRGKYTKEFSGTGIGLACSKSIVESHKGRIWVESMGKEKGSTFFIRIPQNYA